MPSINNGGFAFIVVVGSLGAFLVAVIVTIYRAFRRRSVVVPAIVALITFVTFFRAAGDLASAFKAVVHAREEEKSAFLVSRFNATGASAMRDLLIGGLVIGLAILFERQRDRRREAPSSAVTASEAPKDSECPHHSGVPAKSICARCGTFCCDLCIATSAAHCFRCAAS